MTNMTLMFFLSDLFVYIYEVIKRSLFYEINLREKNSAFQKLRTLAVKLGLFHYDDQFAI